MGNVIYSFSLDPIKHKHFIHMLEMSKNKSALIRHALHQVNLMSANRDYKIKIEKLCTKAYEDLGWVLPSFTKIMNHCMLKYEYKVYHQLDDNKIILEDLQETILALQEVHNSYLEQE
tara:strand:+ start:443 stop:796 length:354 start_codon:yes stop_codon:yes gene_type:complete